MLTSLKQRILFFIMIFFAVTLLMGLGGWQIARYLETKPLYDHINQQFNEPPTPLNAGTPPENWQSVTINGLLLTDLPIFLHQQVFEGRVGAQVFYPLLRTDGPPLLIMRGWIPYDKKSALTQTKQEVYTELHGIIRYPNPNPPKVLTNKPETNEWYFLDLAAIQQTLSLDEISPFYLVDQSLIDDQNSETILKQTKLTLPRKIPHLAYAATWFSLGIIFIIGGIVFLRKTKGQLK